MRGTLCLLVASLSVSTTTGCGEARPTRAIVTGGGEDASASSGGGGAGGGADAGGLSACSAMHQMACFSNYDCLDPKTRCANQGTRAEPVPCCEMGARGAGKMGEPCTAENDCLSALCVDAEGPMLCTERCTADSDCPPELPQCISLAFSGTPYLFCLP
jgi:hypothetical protein